MGQKWGGVVYVCVYIDINIYIYVCVCVECWRRGVEARERPK